MDESYYWLSSLVIPRPIAWVSTLHENGKVNLAPFSSFNYVAHSPPLVAININRLADNSQKDTAKNILREKECVIQIGELDYVNEINMSSTQLNSSESELDLIGMETVDSTLVSIPRLASGSIQLECILDKVIPLGTGVNELFILEVKCFHVLESILSDNKILHDKYKPLARVSGPYYASLSDVFRVD